MAVVEAPFGCLVLDSAILAVAKRGRLPRVDGLAREIRDIEEEGLSIIVSQELGVYNPLPDLNASMLAV